jgi:hypothetical protein
MENKEKQTQPRLSARLRAGLMDVNILTHVVLGFVLILYGLIDFTNWSQAQISLDRLVDPGFWGVFLNRFVGITIVRFLYTAYGARAKKEGSQAHLDSEVQIIQARKKIESDDRLDEFREYVVEEVDRDELLETYEGLLTKKVSSLTNSFNPFFRKSRLRKIDALLEERKNLRDFRSALNSKDSARLEKAFQKFHLSDVIISGRKTVTPDTMFDGYKENSSYKDSLISFDESREVRTVSTRESLTGFITTLIFTLTLQDIILTTENWQGKLANLVVTVFLLVSTMVLAITAGAEIANKALASKNTRLRYLSAFNSRPKKVYPQPKKEPEREPFTPFGNGGPSDGPQEPQTRG